MVAIPIANDQPGVAARVVWTSTGVMVPFSHLSRERLRVAVRAVLSEAMYSDRAKHFQTAIRASSGVECAVDIVEQAIATGRPVLRAVDDPSPTSPIRSG